MYFYIYIFLCPPPKVCSSVVRALHLRDTRRHFCPKAHWTSSRVFLPRLSNSSYIKLFINTADTFQRRKWRTKEQLC